MARNKKKSVIENEPTTLTPDEMEKIETVTEFTGGEKITDEDRDDTIRKEWRPYYEAQLAELVTVMEGRYGSPLEKEVMKKLKATAKVCAKNKAVMVKKYGK